MKNRRNLLISADTFSYLFKEDELETRTKSGLLLLAKDLSNKYSFPVLIVRPKPMLAKNYVNVPFEIEEQFLKKYGAYAKLQKGSNNRIVSSGNLSRASDVRISSDGNTYLVDMAEIWENCFPDRAFGMFKMQFFSEKLRSRKGEYSISPRVLAEIRYHDDFGAVAEEDMTKKKRVGMEDFHEFFRYGPDVIMPRNEPDSPRPYDTWEPGWNFGTD